MGETRAVKDLATGDRIQVKGFDDPLVVRSAKKVLKGTDAGKLDVKLAGPDETAETVRFDPEEAVGVVAKDAGRGQQPPKAAGKGKARRASGKTPEALAAASASAEVPPLPETRPDPAATDALPVTSAQAELPATDILVAEAPPAGETTPAEAAAAVVSPPGEPPATGTPTPEPTRQDAKPKRARGKEARPKGDGQPAKLSAIDAAAKVLGETGQPMNCQKLIGAMAAKGYWGSPAGKTPAGTLYTVVTMLPKAC
jgi:hypothetical protein